MQLKPEDVLPVYGLVNLSTNEWLRLRDLASHLGDDLVLFTSEKQAHRLSELRAPEFAAMPLTPYQMQIYGLTQACDPVELIQTVK